MKPILKRIDAGGRHRLLRGTALLASLAPAALIPECFAGAIVNSIASISVESIASVAALSNALTLIP